MTPEEYQKGLEILWDTLKPVEGVTEEMLDRMAAMGIISIFDVEEIGRNVLEEDLEIPKQISDRCINEAVDRSKEVTAEQEAAKIAEEAQRAEEEAAAAAVLDVPADTDSEAAADSILNFGDKATEDSVSKEVESADSNEVSEVAEVSEETETEVEGSIEKAETEAEDSAEVETEDATVEVAEESQVDIEPVDPSEGEPTQEEVLTEAEAQQEEDS